MKIAVIMKDGFEELEALGIVDMARRLDIQCHIIGFGEEYITGSNKVQIKADLMFDQMDDQYDAIVLPGGPGALTLREDERVIELVKAYHQQNKVFYPEKFRVLVFLLPLLLKASLPYLLHE